MPAPGLKINSQSGNVFFIVLLGVVLFAALVFVVSRSMRSEATAGMSKRQSELAAVDILSYGQKLEHAVGKLLQRGVSENDIDFTNIPVAGYDHVPPGTAEKMVFQISGGGVSWQSPVTGVNDGSEWLLIFKPGAGIKLLYNSQI